MIIIDTNIICRHALQDHEDHSPRANRLFSQVARGHEAVFCPATAIFEAIHILHKLNEAPRINVAHHLHMILNYVGLHLEHSDAVTNALDFWVDQPRLDFADCYHLALAKKLGITQVYSFDKKMDRYPGIERIEPL